MGRKTKCTPDRAKRIAKAIRDGNDKAVAAQLGGITEASFYNWINRGEEEQKHIESGGKPRRAEKFFLEFLESIKKAEAEHENFNLAIIQKAAKGVKVGEKRTVVKEYTELRGTGENVREHKITETTTTEVERIEYSWQAAAWIMERKHPQRWALRHRSQNPYEGEKKDTSGLKEFSEALANARDKHKEQYAAYDAEAALQ